MFEFGLSCDVRRLAVSTVAPELLARAPGLFPAGGEYFATPSASRWIGLLQKRQAG